MSKKIVVAGVASGLACLVPLTALAQAAAVAASPASAASAPSLEIARVIITAQKRKEDIRDVPLSVSVVTAEQLVATQINNVEDLTRNIPNVSFVSQGGPGLGTVEIRGVSSQAGTATVATYLDDVSLTTRNLYSQGSAEPRFFDIQDIEVLRGPQGTLYGASSLGGTIKYISKQPDAKQLSGTASAEISKTQHGGTNYQAEGVINLPLVKDAVALRVGVQSGHDSGWVDQVDPTTMRMIAKGINSSRWDVLKMALKADINKDWSITPALFAQYTHTDDIDATYATVGSYQYPPSAPNSNPPALGAFQTSKTVREPGNDRLTVPSLTVNGDLGVGDLTAVLSGYKRRFDRIQDGTSVNSSYIATLINTDPVAYPNGAALKDTVNSLPSAVQLQNTVDQTSLELRMTSKDYDANRSPFTWVGGAFFSEARTQVFDNEPVFGINKAFQNAGEDINDTNALSGSFAGAFTGDNSYYSARHYKDKQDSVFGELTYHVLPSLSATAGVRVLRATQHFTREGDFFFAGDPPVDAAIDTKAHATTPRIALNWVVNPEVSMYGNVAKGFRLGGANRPIPYSDAVQGDLNTLHIPGLPPATFAPDSLWSYEGGTKLNLLDNRVSLNLAAFYINWKNIQQDVILPSSGFDYETNVGNATSRGFEAELKAKLTAGLTLTGSFGITHATFSSDQPSLGYADPAATQLNVRKGDQVQGVPRFSGSMGFDYSTAVTGNVNGFVRGNAQWTGSSRGSLSRTNPDFHRAGYFTADGSTGVNFDSWELSLFAKNLTNTRTVIQRPSVQFLPEQYQLRPRTIGVSGNYEF
jgi:iron complex outermembrane receptor protein